MWCQRFCFFFFFNDTATTEIYTLSLHDALPISTSLPPNPQITSSPDVPRNTSSPGVPSTSQPPAAAAPMPVTAAATTTNGASAIRIFRIRVPLARSSTPGLRTSRVIRVEASPRLAPEVARCHEPLQQRWRSEPRLAELVVQDLADVQARVEPDEVGERQRPHRMVQPEMDG